MIGIYFSGTGNTKYCVEKLMQAYDPMAEVTSIEEENVVQKISLHSEIVIGYPVQFSNIPRMVKDFIADNPSAWKGRNVFVVATMGLFSGDGAGILARLLRKYGANIIGGLHLKMPDSIGDEKALKRPLHKNQELVAKAVQKIEKAAQELKDGNPPQEGLGFLYHAAGLLGQRLYFYNKTKNYSDRLKIDENACVKCGKCAAVCPMHNISMGEEKAIPGNKCTMCYRCISLCPTRAITLLGKKVYEQCRIEKYL
ncbi:MAG: 4Fe-4S binding protein [Lachnospiraceae bacterium]|nr:4Fe-4S binding protein [Lachnospiraceae bacterium]